MSDIKQSAQWFSRELQRKVLTKACAAYPNPVTFVCMSDEMRNAYYLQECRLLKFGGTPKWYNEKYWDTAFLATKETFEFLSSAYPQDDDEGSTCGSY